MTLVLLLEGVPQRRLGGNALHLDHLAFEAEFSVIDTAIAVYSAYHTSK